MSEPDKLQCEQALRFLAEFIDGELREKDRAAVQAHLHTCRSCYSRLEFESRLKSKLGELASPEAPAKVRRRIHDLIKGF